MTEKDVIHVIDVYPADGSGWMVNIENPMYGLGIEPVYLDEAVRRIETRMDEIEFDFRAALFNYQRAIHQGKSYEETQLALLKSGDALDIYRHQKAELDKLNLASLEKGEKHNGQVQTN